MGRLRNHVVSYVGCAPSFFLKISVILSVFTTFAKIPSLKVCWKLYITSLCILFYTTSAIYALKQPQLLFLLRTQKDISDYSSLTVIFCNKDEAAWIYCAWQLFDWVIFEATLGPMSTKKSLKLTVITKPSVISILSIITLLSKRDLVFLLSRTSLNKFQVPLILF